MYSAQVTGISFHSADSIDDGNMEGQAIENLAQDIAQRQQGWGPLDQLSGEDVTLFSRTLVGLRAPSVWKLQ